MVVYELKACEVKLFINNETLSLVQFNDDRSEECRNFSRTLEDLSRNFAHKVTVGKIDNNPMNRMILDHYGIKTFPAFIFFRNGRIVNKVMGADRNELLGLIHMHGRD